MKAKIKRKKIQFDDLHNDCLMEVLEQLEPAELLKMVRVNKRLKKLAEIKLSIKIKRVFIRCERNFPMVCQNIEFAENEIVDLGSMFIKKDGQKQINKMNEVAPKPSSLRRDLRHAEPKVKFLKTMAKFTSVRSIDFGMQELTDPVLRKITQFCSCIECVIINHSSVTKKTWLNFFRKVGPQIDHFSWLVRKDSPRSTVRMLEMITEKCPNLKQVDISTRYSNQNLIALLKKLPAECYVDADVGHFRRPVFDDTINFLSCHRIDWSVFGPRNQRMLTLMFEKMDNPLGPYSGVEFVNLKRLSYFSMKTTVQPEFNFFAASRFPQLKTFEFQATCGLNEDDYDNVFRSMPVLEKLEINYLITSSYFWQMNILYCAIFAGILPLNSILQLKKLSKLEVSIFNEAILWTSSTITHLIQVLNWYIDEIPSLEKITVLASGKDMPKIADELELMKSRQSRVKIVYEVE